MDADAQKKNPLQKYVFYGSFPIFELTQSSKFPSDLIQSSLVKACKGHYSNRTRLTKRKALN